MIQTSARIEPVLEFCVLNGPEAPTKPAPTTPAPTETPAPQTPEPQTPEPERREPVRPAPSQDPAIQPCTQPGTSTCPAP
jgi:hypothetical protein